MYFTERVGSVILRHCDSACNYPQQYSRQIKTVFCYHKIIFIFPRFISLLHTKCLINQSQELIRLVSIGWTLIWEAVDCVYWIAVSNVTHAAASVRSHVHLHTSASDFTKSYLLSIHPDPGRNIKFDICEFIRDED